MSNTSARRIESIDFLKGLAIIFVIITHAVTWDEQKMVLGTLYIGQAVPIFLFVAGITSELSFTRNGYSLKNYYLKLPRKIIYLWGWYLLFALMFMAFRKTVISWQAIYEQLVFGPIGAGGYFVPLMVQHIVFFPIIMILKRHLNNTLLFVLLAFFITALLEYLCVAFEVNAGIYRVLYVRYIAVAALGAVFTDWMALPKKLTLPLCILSMAYILAVVYFDFKIPIIPDLWTNHHYPAYFYTAGFCTLFTVVYSKIPGRHFLSIMGKASYMIYLFQMLYFTVLCEMNPETMLIVRLGMSLPICILAGLAFDKIPTLYKSYKRSLASG